MHRSAKDPLTRPGESAFAIGLPLASRDRCCLSAERPRSAARRCYTTYLAADRARRAPLDTPTRRRPRAARCPRRRRKNATTGTGYDPRTAARAHALLLQLVHVAQAVATSAGDARRRGTAAGLSGRSPHCVYLLGCAYRPSKEVSRVTNRHNLRRRHGGFARVRTAGRRPRSLDNNGRRPRAAADDDGFGACGAVRRTSRIPPRRRLPREGRLSFRRAPLARSPLARRLAYRRRRSPVERAADEGSPSVAFTSSSAFLSIV